MSRANQLTGTEWLKNSFSIWRGLGRDTSAKQHPAAFPVALAARLIDCYCSNPDGIVLDPFAGSGSTLLAALKAGMSTIGVDINPSYREMFIQRLSLENLDDSESSWQYQVRDSRELSTVLPPNSIEICVTSPPYWDILNQRRTADGKRTRSYSENKHDIGNIGDYGGFLTALCTIADQIEVSLRQGGYFILNVMDVRKGSKFFPLHADVIYSIQEKTTMTLEDIIIWDRQSDYNSMRPLGYPYKFLVNKVHEYLLVFRKV